MLRFWTFKLLTTLISREKLSKKFGWKTRENVGDLHFLVVDNFDFPRKIVKFCQNWIFGHKFDFSNSVSCELGCQSRWKKLFAREKLCLRPNEKMVKLEEIIAVLILFGACQLTSQLVKLVQRIELHSLVLTNKNTCCHKVAAKIGIWTRKTFKIREYCYCSRSSQKFYWSSSAPVGSSYVSSVW